MTSMLRGGSENSNRSSSSLLQLGFPDLCSSIREAFLITGSFQKRQFKVSFSTVKLPNGILKQSFEQTSKVIGCFIIY